MIQCTLAHRRRIPVVYSGGFSSGDRPALGLYRNQAVGSSEQAVLRFGSYEPDRRLARRRNETPEYP